MMSRVEMGDGRWEMGDGRWEMGDGRWGENGERRTDNGERTIPFILLILSKRRHCAFQANDFEERKFPEIRVVGVDASDAVLMEECGEMGIRHQVAAYDGAAGEEFVMIREILVLGNDADARQAHQGPHIRPCGLGRERPPEDGWVGGNPQIGEERGPRQAAEIRIRHAALHEIKCGGVFRTAGIAGVEQEVGIDGVAQNPRFKV